MDEAAAGVADQGGVAGGVGVEEEGEGSKGYSSRVGSGMALSAFQLLRASWSSKGSCRCRRESRQAWQ